MLLLATKGTQQWLVSLICEDFTQSSGGCHRSAQLHALLEHDGWHLTPVAPPDPPVSRWQTVQRGISAARKHGFVQPLGIDSLRSQGHVAHSVATLHRRFPRLTGILQEGTGYGALSATALWRDRGVQTILVPANIESLAPNYHSWTHQGFDVAQRFAHERRWWAIADAIFTISVEEAWWLQLHGIQAEHLPYYPAPQHYQQLLALRASRQPCQQTGYLWLADFRNPANRIGVELTLAWINRLGPPPFPIKIVGRGSDWLRQEYSEQLPASCQILGELCEQELTELQRTCIAQLIVHPATSGMLTRVINTAVSGIPILGNDMAFKSAWSLFAPNSINPTSWPTSLPTPYPPKICQSIQEHFLSFLQSNFSY